MIAQGPTHSRFERLLESVRLRVMATSKRSIKQNFTLIYFRLHLLK